jgi:hypothetical protein
MLYLSIGTLPSVFAQGSITFSNRPPVFPPIPTTPTNDVFLNARGLNGGLVTLTNESLHNSTSEPGEPAHGEKSAFRSVWYRWTAPYYGESELALTSLFELSIGIYQGSELTNLVAVQRSFSTRNRVRWMANAGDEFLIAVNQSLDSPTFFGPSFNLRLVDGGIRLIAPFERIGKAGFPMELRFDRWETNSAVTRLDVTAGTNLIGTLTDIESALVWNPETNGEVELNAEALIADGQRVFMVPQRFFIKPANDHLEDATLLPSRLVNRTITFDRAGATFQAGEPTYNYTPPGEAGSLWWKWKPEQTTRTYLSASFSKLSVFEGDIGHLTLVTTAEPIPVVIRAWEGQGGSSGSPGLPPYSFQSVAGKTYWFSAVTTLTSNTSWNISQRLHWLESVNGGSVGYAEHPFSVRVTGATEVQGPTNILLRVLRYMPSGDLPYWRWEDVQVHNLTNGPGFEFTWVPDVPGEYELRAMGTYPAGETWTSTLRLEMHNSGDTLQTASLLTGFTNVTFQTGWATVDENEPVYGTNRLGPTVWWRWRTETNAQVRLSVSGTFGGLPLDIFTETNGVLTRVAHNDGRTLLLPLRGYVSLQAEAGVEYVIRVSDSLGASGPLIGLPMPSTTWFDLVIENAYDPIRGLVFLTTVLGKPNESGVIDWETYSRVLKADGSPATNFNYRAQFYSGETLNDLRSLGPIVPIFVQPGTGEPGGVSAGLADALTFGGTKMWIQLRAWDAQFGATYAAARANGGAIGRSRPIEVMVGSELTGPTVLTNLADVRIGTIVTGFTPGELRQSGRNAQGAPVFELRAPRGFLYSVDESRNGNSWTPILLLTNVTGSVKFTDPRAELPAATMYRTRIVD